MLVARLVARLVAWFFEPSIGFIELGISIWHRDSSSPLQAELLRGNEEKQDEGEESKTRLGYENERRGFVIDEARRGETRRDG